MPRGIRSTILLIEPDTSLRRLIVLGLQHRGLQVFAVGSLQALADQPVGHPDLLILDIDNGSCDDAVLLTTVQKHPFLSTLPLVVLAWERETQAHATDETSALVEYQTKPFDARRLHATIENLLETSAALQQPERQTTAVALSHAFVAGASLCPLITASGLLLTVIGLMLQFMVAGLGLLVILVGLLWWTLGKRPTNQFVLEEVGQTYAPSLP